MDSKDTIFMQGLPQGSVMSPILFIIFINDLTDQWPENVKCSMFADDLADWTSDKSVDTCKNAIQRTAEHVSNWSQKWLMSLSPSKCEVTLFSTNAKDSKREVEIKIGEKRLSMQPNPKFLGVTYDYHIIAKKAKRRS